MNQWFERLTEQMSLISDVNDAQKVLDALTAEAGFNGYTYVRVQPGTCKVISNYAQVWQDRYNEKKFSKVDPVAQGLRKRIGVFTSAAPTGRVSKEQRQFFAEAAKFGIRSRVSIPVNAGFGHVAMLTLASEDLKFAESRKIDPIVAAAAVGQMHTRLDVMNISPRLHIPVRLKPDELTCLKWSSEGKSMKAIAVIEDTSYANVCFHLGNAKQALGATTLPQATAIATALGLI